MNYIEPVETLITRLHQNNIRVWIDAGSLKCSDPDGRLNDAVMSEIRTRKNDILAFLNMAHAEAGAPGQNNIPARHETRPPLSFAQERLWLIDQIYPGSALHHICIALDVQGTLDLDALRAALAAVMNRHAVLRARIYSDKGVPGQTISADCDTPFSVVSISPADAAIEDVIHAETSRPFDLAAEPPIRLLVVKCGDGRHVLVFTLHHICADGWSTEILLRDLGAFYSAQVFGSATPEAALPIQYGDFAAWQRQRLAAETAGALEEFWKQHLSQPLQTTQLVTDMARTAGHGHAGELHDFSIDKATADALRKIAAAHGTTLFTALFTAFNLLIHRYTGQTDLVIGTPVASRPHVETEDLVGLFVNPLPVRSRVDPYGNFEKALRQTHETLQQVISHQDMPFERIVDMVGVQRDPDSHPLFQIKFQLDAAPRERIRLPGLEMRRLARQDKVSRLDLCLDLRETEAGLSGTVEYKTALFYAETIGRFASHFQQLLKSIIANPSLPIATLALLTREEQQQRVCDFNSTAQENAGPHYFHELFEAHVARAPDAVALIMPCAETDGILTYGELNARANRLARLLQRKGVTPETVVAISLPRGFDMIVAWLAVWKAGGAYLPLDPDYPAERIGAMLSDARARLVVSHSSIDLPATADRLNLDEDFPHDERADNLETVTHPSQLAYVIYTSGSTGKAKGVLVDHSGLINLTRDKIRACDIRPGDCVLQFFSFSFDASIPELVMSLGAGARLLLLPGYATLPGAELADILHTRQVTHLTMTPSALLSLPVDDLPSLRTVLVGGEVPMPELIERWGKNRRFINAYGPTETTVNASMVDMGGGRAGLPVLRPAANKQLYVLDDNLELLPFGVPGELHIGGCGIARGYHDRAALTAERFVPDPFATNGRAGVLYRTGDRAMLLADGRIHVSGRLDSQVKIRGYRIEPGEIEAGLLAHPFIVSATVAVRDDGRGGKRLAAYAVPQTDQDVAVRPTPSEIRAWLAHRLPKFLVPDTFDWLDALPLTVNGKIDPSRLPAPRAETNPDGRAPEGEMETRIASAFGHVLNIDQVAATDDFFALGGHSLLATRFCAVAKEKFGLDIGVLDLFNASTVEALANRLRTRDAGDSGSDEETLLLKRDIKLDDAIRPSATARAESGTAHVFLTGATGFLGTYLLHELLRAPARKVTCLVRGDDGMNRLRQAFRQYDLPQSVLTERVTTLTGELSKPNLGLAAADYDHIVRNADCIFHNGAEVHHLHRYERLRETNVLGTREVLKLACAGAGRHVHYISTLSALTPRRGSGSDARPVCELESVEGFAPPAGGYNRSKWVAEHLVNEAGKRGLPVTIYRPGAISGDSVTGAFNGSDILCRLVQAYLYTGTAPEGERLLDMLPVDHVARAIVHLSGKPASAGQVFHLIHSSPVSSARLFEACEMEGIELERVSQREWQDMLGDVARGTPDHPLYPLLGLLRSPSAAGKSDEKQTRNFDCHLTQAAMSDAPFREPALTFELLRTYLRAFAKANFLNATSDDARKQGER
ncbi:thioester reductase domain-containing protein [Agrobacterium sp. O3.4]|uniref:Thioester reductase domain-containing protein n=1 Tax=Agrobacterium cucumeris TaxID=2862866 RepID=A0ABY8RQC1_9HYPH|nr:MULTISPECIES: non-ribosomal peptide synthetase [Rhizobium/Agrobacterium group]MCZ7471830.1 thioester reductase domain-containing protein [Rhizobium rhizogenes]WHO09786.1 thioester reductase domain-containing protein [Agrobacterium cucumeris]